MFTTADGVPCPAGTGAATAAQTRVLGVSERGVVLVTDEKGNAVTTKPFSLSRRGWIENVLFYPQLRRLVVTTSRPDSPVFVHAWEGTDASTKRLAVEDYVRGGTCLLKVEGRDLAGA